MLFSSLILYHDTVTFREAGVIYSMTILIPTALETLLSILLNKRASFGKLLDEAGKRGVVLHETLKKSLDCLYGYASQVARHGSKDEYNANDAEARFVLITSSALCNLMIASFEGAIVKS